MEFDQTGKITVIHLQFLRNFNTTFPSLVPSLPSSSPLSFKDITDLGMSCMADYGAPVFSFLAVGGYESE